MMAETPFVMSALVFLAVAVVVASIATRALRVPAGKSSPVQPPLTIPVPPPLAQSPVALKMPFCPQCGLESPEGRFCPGCGYQKSGTAALTIPPGWKPPLADTPRRKPNNWWPEIFDEASARRAATQGMWAAFFCAGATAVLVLLAKQGVAIPVDGLGTGALLDAALMAVIGFGIRGMSRTAALAGLLLYLAEQTYNLGKMQSPLGLPIPMIIVIVTCFLNAIRGTFAYPRYAR